MEPEKSKIINVSDINAWLYCARKLYLMKVCGLRSSPNRNMIVGKIKHNIIERFSKTEQEFISKIDKDYDRLDLVLMYESFIKKTSTDIFFENIQMIDKYLIDMEDMLKKILRDFAEDIKLRTASIKEALSKGCLKDEIWKNLDSVYLSELKLESESLGLKGRVDRVLINKKTGSIIPFELKSREDRIFLSDELQLTAYAMLLEESYHTKVGLGIVEVGNKRQELSITEENKKEVLKIADNIRNFSESDSLIPPIQSNFNKCRTCEFKEECMKLQD